MKQDTLTETLQQLGFSQYEAQCYSLGSPPAALARLLAQALPHCTATFYPDEGHFSTVANHAQDILNTLSI
jgi:hypothetical protein